MGLAFLEELVVVAADFSVDVRARKSGVLVRQRNIGAVAALEIEIPDAQPVAHLQILRAPAPVAIGKAVDPGVDLVVEQFDRAEEILAVLVEREAVPDQPRGLGGP